MDEEVLFTERQHFKQWWLWLILWGINGLLLFGVFKQVLGSFLQIVSISLKFRTETCMSNLKPDFMAFSILLAIISRFLDNDSKTIFPELM